jgi:methylmalonyl-CoA/ethylmalonyl-CoA epimerase
MISRPVLKRAVDGKHRFMSTHSEVPNWRMHHFAVSTPNLDETAGWYRDHLGFEDDFAYEVPDMGLRALFLRGPDFRLEIFALEQVSAQPEDEARFDRYLGVQGLKHIALGVEDLDAARIWLETRGVTFVNDTADVPASGGERFAFIEAPDGVLLEIYEPHHQP